MGVAIVPAVVTTGVTVVSAVVSTSVAVLPAVLTTGVAVVTAVVSTGIAVVAAVLTTGIAVLGAILPAIRAGIVSRVAVILSTRVLRITELVPCGSLHVEEFFFRRVPGVAIVLAPELPSVRCRIPGLTDVPAIPVHGVRPLRGQFTSPGGRGVPCGVMQRLA